MSVPNTPMAAVTAINPTNATIMITVPSIAYTNETYHILYTGQERDTDLAQSNTISGTEDIIAINSTYTITLSHLEENTTYNYTVIASNCIGNTSTATMSFRTSLVPGKIMKNHVNTECIFIYSTECQCIIEQHGLASHCWSNQFTTVLSGV